MYEFFILLTLYFLLYVALYSISLKIKSTYFDKFVEIILYPFLFVFGILLVIFPFSVLLFHILFYFAFAFILQSSIYNSFRYFHFIEFLTYETAIYLILTSGVFLSATMNTYLKAIVYKVSPFISNKSKKLKVYEFDKQTDYLLTTENIRFLTYGFYFVALIIVNCINFQNKSLFVNETTDKAILQSFVTFIAFDRAYSIRRDLSFKLSKMMNIIKESILRDFNSFKRKD